MFRPERIIPVARDLSIWSGETLVFNGKLFSRRTDAVESGGDVRPDREELQETRDRGDEALRQSDARTLDSVGLGVRYARRRQTQVEGKHLLLLQSFTKSHYDSPTTCFVFCSQKILSLGEETINTSVFVQMDAEHVYLMCETLSKFVLVGEPDASVVSSPPAKTLKLALFGSLNRKFKYDVRVHVVEDNGVALEVSTRADERDVF